MVTGSRSRSGRLLVWLLVPLALVGVVLVAAAGLGGGYASALGVAWLAERFEKKSVAEEEPFPVAGPVPLFDDWPSEKPALVLVISGEMLGYMRPCGCSEGQSGGLARRAGLFEYLRSEKGWETLPIDFGDLVKAESPWDEARYRYTIESLKALGYKALGIGTRDLSIKAMTVAGEALNADPLQMVAANLQSDQDDFNVVVGEFIFPMRILESAGKKIGVGSLIGESMQGEIRDQSIKLLPTTEAMKGILEKMTEGAADLKILFAHVPQEEALKLAEANPGFDLVVCRSPLEHPTNEDAKMVGSTLVAWVGQKGMEVGAVGFWPEGNPKLRFEVIPIDPRFKEGEEINEIYGRFVAMLGEEDYLSKLPKLPHPSGAEYVGSNQCAACHKKAFAKWEESKHSHALETLEKAKPEGQDLNPECVTCHVVGLNYKSGFDSLDRTPHLRGVGCESCHGPGSKHVANEKDEAGRAMMRVSKNVSDCIKCHDAENSVHFNFDTYWPKIAHPWKD